MKIAIASGKGGTGKTTVSVALALAADEPVQYLDCDVEEPNGELFLQPQNCASVPAYVMVPRVDTAQCDGCGDCADFCQFNAIVSQGHYALVFPELCHSCGGCALVCPHQAIFDVEQPLGTITTGQHRHIHYVQGKLNIGMSMASPLIHQVKQYHVDEQLTLLDCPPGTSCSMVATVRDADFIILVTEPTPFGLNDLQLAVATVRQLDRPFGVIINRYQAGHRLIEDYCSEQHIPVLMTIPDKRTVAQACANGSSLLSVLPELTVPLRCLLNEIKIGINEVAVP